MCHKPLLQPRQRAWCFPTPEKQLFGCIFIYLFIFNFVRVQPRPAAGLGLALCQGTGPHEAEESRSHSKMSGVPMWVLSPGQ